MNLTSPTMRRRRFLHILGGAAAGGAAGLILPGPLGQLLSPDEARAATGPAFPLDAASAARILEGARSRGADFAELYLERRVRTQMRMADGQIESVEQGIFAGCGIRAVSGERTGYAYADGFDIDTLVKTARNAAAISTGEPVTAPTGFRPTDPPQVVTCARAIDEVTADERVTWLTQADAGARGFDPGVTQVTIDHTDEMLHFAVINSDGLWVEDRLPLLYLRINVNATRNGGRGTGTARVSHRLGAEQMDDDAAGKAGAEAARMAVTMCEATDAPAGEMPVILAAGGGVLFHEAVGHGLEGDFAMRGTSFYTGKIGQLVASERVSVVDTGGIPDLRGSFNVDDEGTAPIHNVLIEKGVLRGFMTDRITATALDLPRSGNGRRQSYRHPPLVRMTNTFLAAGEDDVDEIIRDTRSGLFAAALGGGEVDTTSGNFTFGVREAYRIEDGKLGAPVRGANLVGNGPEIMSRIDRVGPDQKFWNGTCGKGQWVPVTSGAPTMRISHMTVGGSGG